MFRKIADACAVALTAAALMGSAAAQAPGRNQGYNQLYNVQTPQQLMGGDASQLLVGVWQIRSRTGATHAEYRQDGSVAGEFFAPNARQGITFQGRYSAQNIGNGRIALTIMATLRGKASSSTNTLRMMPDGNLFNETAQAIAYRVR